MEPAWSSKGKSLEVMIWSTFTFQKFMRIGGIDSGGDEFGGGFPGHGENEKVLHRGEELSGGAVGLVVVTAQGKEISHFLVKALLGGPDVPDALQHLVEVIRAAIRVLQALVVTEGQAFCV